MSITTRVPYGFEMEAMPLEAFGGVGGHRLKPIPGSLQLHGGGFKKAIVPILAITAAVVAPIAIPAIAGAIPASLGLSQAVAYAASGAIYGATAGALTAAVGGGNIGESALIGGALGGIGGYLAAPADVSAVSGASGAAGAGGAGTSSVVTNAPAAAGSTVATGAPATGSGLGGAGIQSVGDITRQVAAGTAGPSFVSPIPSTAAGNIGSTLSGTAGTTGIAGTGIPSVMAQAPQITPQALGVGTGAGLGPTNAAVQAGQMVGGAKPQPGFFERVGAGLKETGSAIADRFTDPQMQADLILRAAGQMAGSAIAGSGLTEEQQQLVDMQMAELQQLQQTNEAAFNQRLEAAQAMLGESRYFDPEYFGLQRARQQQTAGAQAKRAGLRGLTGEERRAEARRYDIETGRNVGTAYDQGYLTGVQGRLEAQQAGLAQMPLPSQYASASYGQLSNTLAEGERQRTQNARTIGGLFGGLTGMEQSRRT